MKHNYLYKTSALLMIALLSQSVTTSYGTTVHMGNNTTAQETYHYDNFSRLVSTTLSDGLTKVYQYTDYNRLHALQYYRDRAQKQLITSYTYQYDHQGNIIDRIRQDGTGQHAQEQYAYDKDDNLTNYQCQGNLCPSDQLGNQIQSQHYQFDAVNNISQVESTLTTPQKQSLSNTTTYRYDSDIPTRLIGYKNSVSAYGQSATIVYDKDGNITEDDQGNLITYGPFDQTLTVTTANAKMTYLTDGNNIQVGERATQADQTISQYFVYGQNKLLNTQQGGQWTSFLYGAQRFGEDDSQGVQYDLTDQGGSVIKRFGNDSSGTPVLLSASVYSPYGIETPLQVRADHSKK